MTDPSKRVRLDKWLWAARFFKTRAKAKDAIDGGKVECDGVRAKPAKEITVGAELRIRQGFDLKVVRVTGLSNQRRGAAEAMRLYEETSESIAKREREAERRRAQRAMFDLPDQRPNRRDRRTLEKIKKEGGF